MRWKRSVAVALAVVLACGVVPGVGARTVAEECFPQTGKCVNGPFLDYWRAHGGLAINGYPLTEARQETLENGQQYLVQWFERVRMELHPENAPPYDVLLGQFGRLIHPADPGVGPKGGQRFFPETGHNMGSEILAYWEQNGGLAQFGYPLTEEFQEKLENGQTYTVQYTERARFERHPENGPPYNILLGQFGRAILARGPQPPAGWGRTLTPLGGGAQYADPRGRYVVSRPGDWSPRVVGDSVFFIAPSFAGVEIALNDGHVFANIDQVNDVIDGQVRQRPNYQLLSLEKVLVGPYPGYRRAFQHTNDEGHAEVIVRIYFLTRGFIYNANGFMEPHDLGLIGPIIDGIGGSIRVGP